MNELCMQQAWQVGVYIILHQDGMMDQKEFQTTVLKRPGLPFYLI